MVQRRGIEMASGEEGNAKEEHAKEEHGKEEHGKERGAYANLQIDVTPYKVEPGTEVHLDSIDTHSTGTFAGGKKAGKELLKSLTKQLAKLQEVFYAQSKHRLLIVLQAMDSGGKDGTIAHVFGEVNPQGVEVASFKAPTPVELAHDYLWRIHPYVPANGEIVVFNRSHYEDVLIVRVHNLVQKEAWKRRYAQINAFERILAEEGTTILKFYLHIDKQEQKERLQARLDDPEKNWKFNIEDLAERKLWNDYMAAYEEAIHRTSTEYAPWYIVPSGHKWYRNLIVAQTIVQTIEALHPTYPAPKMPVKNIKIDG